MRDAYNRADDEESITHHAKRQGRDDATHQYQQLQRGGFGFLRSQGKPDLISKNSTIALSSPSALSIKPECPAGLRDEGLSLLISAALSKSTAEDQTQHEPNSERRKYCFCWIFSDVLLGVFLERSSAALGIAPGLFCFAARFAPLLLCLAAVFFRKSACG